MPANKHSHTVEMYRPRLVREEGRLSPSERERESAVTQVICVKMPLHPSSQDRDFVAKQKEDLELAMRKLTAENRREICDKERDCLSKKQELLRGGAQSHSEW